VAGPMVPPMGERIRQERTRKGVSVRELARQIGVSPSLISQIETDKSNPSVSTLYAITTALRISVEELFDSRSEGGVSATDVSPRWPVASRDRRVGPVVGPDQREMLTLESGVTWELLGRVPNVHAEFLRITYQPGSTSSTSGLLMRHSGFEYGIVLSGELLLTLGFEEYRIGPGDSVSFDSTTPHRYRNEGTEPAVGIWFVLEDSH
jgi:DNA-binding XRE family transcriptional regulator/quercetin dioxygenase-like cupin family protein